jgi:hypothetical protein
VSLIIVQSICETILHCVSLIFLHFSQKWQQSKVVNEQFRCAGTITMYIIELGYTKKCVVYPIVSF